LPPAVADGILVVDQGISGGDNGNVLGFTWLRSSTLPAGSLRLREFRGFHGRLKGVSLACFFDLLWGEQMASFVRVGEELPRASASTSGAKNAGRWKDKKDRNRREECAGVSPSGPPKKATGTATGTDLPRNPITSITLHVLGTADVQARHTGELRAPGKKKKAMADGGGRATRWAFRTERHLQAYFALKRPTIPGSTPGEGARGITSSWRAGDTNSYVRFLSGAVAAVWELFLRFRRAYAASDWFYRTLTRCPSWTRES